MVKITILLAANYCIFYLNKPIMFSIFSHARHFGGRAIFYFFAVLALAVADCMASFAAISAAISSSSFLHSIIDVKCMKLTWFCCCASMGKYGSNKSMCLRIKHFIISFVLTLAKQQALNNILRSARVRLLPLVTIIVWIIGISSRRVNTGIVIFSKHKSFLAME